MACIRAAQHASVSSTEHASCVVPARILPVIRVKRVRPCLTWASFHESALTADALLQTIADAGNFRETHHCCQVSIFALHHVDLHMCGLRGCADRQALALISPRFWYVEYLRYSCISFIIYIYIYIHMYICTYVHMYICICIYIYI